jgi:TonB family protein
MMINKVKSIKSNSSKYISVLGIFTLILISSNALFAKKKTDALSDSENWVKPIMTNLQVDTTKSQTQEKIYDFSSIEQLPSFVGGMRGWAEYLQANLKYPDFARRNNITGRVIVSFVVSHIGEISDVKVLRGIGGGADEEAVRVLRESPRWKPGYQYGKPVRVAYTMPIFFQLAPKTNEDNLSPFRRNF